jgi:16S rRNA (guanine1516-N2)-methyltransferase
MIRIVCSSADESLLRDTVGKFERLSTPTDDYYLSFEEGVLQLRRIGDRRGVFVTEAEIERRLSGPFLLGRACGLPASDAHVLDATGGLGVDAMALSRRGVRVHIVEREPMLWALLKDLIRRAGATEVTATLADSLDVLAESPVYDVIYLDPMFPERRKKALPGKRMQFLGELLAQSSQQRPFDMALIAVAQSRARSRVVLKRRLKDPLEAAPDWSLKGRSIRYDVFRGFA